MEQSHLEGRPAVLELRGGEGRFSAIGRVDVADDDRRIDEGVTAAWLHLFRTSREEMLVGANLHRISRRRALPGAKHSERHAASRKEMRHPERPAGTQLE